MLIRLCIGGFATPFIGFIKYISPGLTVGSLSVHDKYLSHILRIDTDSDNWTEESVLDAARSVSLAPTETGFTPLLDGADAETEMRGESVTSRVSLVARMPAVREWVNAQVRKANEALHAKAKS